MPSFTNTKDPTNQGRTRKKANREFKRRILSARPDVMALFKAIPRTKRTQEVVANRSEILWDYLFTPDVLEALLADIQQALDDALQTEGNQPLAGWWFEKYDEQSWRAGALSENNNISALVGALISFVALSEIQVTTDQRYLAGLIEEISLSFNSIKGLSDRTAQQIHQVIVAGIKGHRSPRLIREDIIERFRVAVSASRRIVDTEINRLNNNARTLMAVIYREDFGINTAVLHLSALLSTTRVVHGARHGRVFTPESQNAWWNRGSNRINCHCSVRIILLDDNGKIIPNSLINLTKRQRKAFFGEE